jgi:hypothetical protein
MQQMRGGFLIANWEKNFKLKPLIELGINSAEEDVEFADRTQLHQIVECELSLS